MRAAVSNLIPFYHRVRRDANVRRVRREARAMRPLNVVIGGAQTAFRGWLSTDKGILDVCSPSDWEGLFEPSSIDRLLAEHLFEHLSEEECRVAFSECYRYLRSGGLLRIAVPDGYRRDPAYVAEVTPPKDGHKSLFTVHNLPPMLEAAGFSVTLLEYFDASEQFHANPWDERQGFISRSVRFDRQEDFKRGDLFYTSLIVDAVKL